MRYVFVALLLVSALSGAAVAQESPHIDAATTTFDVDLRPDGDADWTVRTTIPFDTDDEQAGFRQYAERFEDGEVAASPGVAFFESAADAASTVAGREMTVTNVERDYTVANGSGTLRLRFHWTNFLSPAGDGYELADALLTEQGTWLRSLESGQEIAVRTPPGYEIQRSSIEARQENDSLVVVGPESFDPQEFSVTYAPEPGNGSDSPGSPSGPEEGFDPLVAALLGVLFVAVLVLAVWRWRGGEPIAEVANGGSPPPTEAADPDPADPEPEDDGVDPELLSDEERVEALLEQNGGRMRQADIVEETDWSDAKVSQLLSRMADEGSVEKLRLGRENVISLPDGEDGHGE